MSWNSRGIFTHGCSLTVKDPTVGRFINTGSYAGIRLGRLQHNSLICSIPVPDQEAGWRIKAIILLYNIKNIRGPGKQRGASGKIVEVELRDARRLVHRFENPDCPANEWRIGYLWLPDSSINSWDFGLSVTIHVDRGPKGIFPTEFLFSSIGLIFSQSVDALERPIRVEGPVKKSKMSKKR
jgi:hypothetical protein